MSRVTKSEYILQVKRLLQMGKELGGSPQQIANDVLLISISIEGRKPAGDRISLKETKRA